MSHVGSGSHPVREESERGGGPIGTVGGGSTQEVVDPVVGTWSPERTSRVTR